MTTTMKLIVDAYMICHATLWIGIGLVKAGKLLLNEEQKLAYHGRLNELSSN